MSNLAMFTLGAALGAAAGLAACRWLIAKRPGIAARLRLSPQAPTELPQEIIEDLPPELAREVRRPSAAPVQDQPAELTKDAAQQIRDAKDAETANAIARRFISNPDVANVIAVLVRWQPRRHAVEDKYQTGFRNFFSKNGYADRVEDDRRLRWGAEEGAQNRVAHPDFVLAPTAGGRQSVLVEIKANLESSAETDRAMGQMLRYLLAWKKEGAAVLAVCGDSPKEIRFLVRLYIDMWRTKLGLPVTVYFKRDDVLPASELARMAVDPE